MRLVVHFETDSNLQRFFVGGKWRGALNRGECLLVKHRVARGGFQAYRLGLAGAVNLKADEHDPFNLRLAGDHWVVLGALDPPADLGQEGIGAANGTGTG